MRRRRECLVCGYRFTTFERSSSPVLFIEKRSGDREPFNREKVVNGVRSACKNRPVSDRDIEEACQHSSKVRFYSSGHPCQATGWELPYSTDSENSTRLPISALPVSTKILKMREISRVRLISLTSRRLRSCETFQVNRPRTRDSGNVGMRVFGDATSRCRRWRLNSLLTRLVVALAIYAHPDDSDVAAGGTLARWSAAGTEVHVVICALGDKGSSNPATDSSAARRSAPTGARDSRAYSRNYEHMQPFVSRRRGRKHY